MNPTRDSTSYLLFGILGATLVAGACMNGAHTMFFLSRAVRTTGIVTDPGPGGRHPFIRFRLPSNHPAGLAGGGIFTPVTAGETVPIIYDPANPMRSAALDSADSIWLPTALSGLIGFGLLLVSAARR